MHYLLLLCILILAVRVHAQDTKPTPPPDPPTLCELMVQSLDRCIKGKKSHAACMLDLRNTLMKGTPAKVATK